MKIGFVSTAFPRIMERSVHGIYQRMGMFIEAMKDIGELDMLFYVDERVPVSPIYVKDMQERLANHWGTSLELTLCHLAPNTAGRGRWQDIVKPALSIFNRPVYSQVSGAKEVHAFDRLLSRSPDVVFAHRLHAMCPILLSKRHPPPIFLDLDDIEHVSFARSVRQPPWWRWKWIQYFQVPSLLFWELRAIRYSKKTFVCSESDRKYLTNIWRLGNVVVIPNSTYIPEERELPNAPTLVFVGNFLHRPNIVGADYLITKVWPAIFSAVPNARLLIAGDRPENIVCFKDKPPGVEFRGFVENLDELYREVRVVCCPILSGGGTRIKILEAGAHGKPIVSTTVGAEGIDLNDGQEILLRDDPASFAEACVRLLKDQNLSARIGNAARSMVARSYDRSIIVHKIREQLAS